jgi:hypothetical protein
MLAVANFRVHEAAPEGSPEAPTASAGKYLSGRMYSGLTKMFKCEFDEHTSLWY